MAEDGKIDKRKLNKGRYGNKGAKHTQTEMDIESTGSNEIENLDQQETINEIGKTGITPHNNQNTMITSDENITEEAKAEVLNNENNDQKGGDEIISSSDSNNDGKIIDEKNLSDKVDSEIYTPLNEKMKEEAYRNIYKGQGDPNKPIEEPVFQKPNFEALNIALGNNAKKTETTEEKKPEGTPMAERSGLTEAIKNPDLKFATPEEKRQGAEQLVDGLLDAYGLLHQLGAWIASVNIDKLVEQEIEGKIDLQVGIPINEQGQEISFKDFLENYNHETKKAIIVEQDFIDKVRPIMIRVCEKNGWGLTDEQYLIYLFGRDIAEKTALIIAMKKGINHAINVISKTHQKAKAVENNIPPQAQNHNTQQTNTSEATKDVITTPVEDVVETKTEVLEDENKLSDLVILEKKADDDLKNQ